MKSLPYDQRAARWLVRPLAHLPVTPNQLTGLTLLLALFAAALFASGTPAAQAWAAGLFVLARFLDHFDGELARLTGNTSAFGYYLDYVAGTLSYAALFVGIGIGLSDGALGTWSQLLGGLGAIAAIVALFLNLELDRQAGLADGDSIGYPALAGFELEDGIYLIAPITWIGYLEPFFVAASLGAGCYLLWTAVRVLLGHAKRPGLGVLRARQAAGERQSVTNTKTARTAVPIAAATHSHCDRPVRTAGGRTRVALSGAKPTAPSSSVER